MTEMDSAVLKKKVKDFWEAETCGVRYGSSSEKQRFFEEIEETRYTLEPYIPTFADFATARFMRVLEIGLGTGVDYSNWLKSGAIATGIDITWSAIEFTRERLNMTGIHSNGFRLSVADAEVLPFDEGTFDLVYSWGVLHHTPRTEVAFQEIYRVLKRGGQLKAMVYHVPSWTGWLVWVAQCLLKARPFMTVRQGMFCYLESPGTKAYTQAEMQQMLSEIGFQEINLQTRLAPSDLLEIKPSKKYRAGIYRAIWRLYPRFIVNAMGNRFGLALLLEATKLK